MFYRNKQNCFPYPEHNKFKFLEGIMFVSKV